MIETKGVVHFTIPVTDIGRSRDFYCKWLGTKVVREAPGAGMVFRQGRQADLDRRRARHPPCLSRGA